MRDGERGMARPRAQRERRDAYLRVMSDCARMGGGLCGWEIRKNFCVELALPPRMPAQVPPELRFMHEDFACGASAIHDLASLIFFPEVEFEYHLRRRER